MDADAFSLLIGGGVRFDKKRFAKDIDSFKPVIRPEPKTAAKKKPVKRDPDEGARTRGGNPETNLFNASGTEDAGDEPPPQSTSMKRSKRGGKHEKTAEGSLGSNWQGEEDPEVQAGEAPAAALTKEEVEEEVLDPGCPDVHSRDPNEADNAVRKHYRIKVSGYDPPPPLRSFAQLATKHGAPAGLLRNLDEGGYEEPTPIQRQAIPILLAGRELLAVAPTGSGKTLAFMLPILSALRVLRQSGDWPSAVKAVILSPTNELAAQQARCLKLLLPGSGLRGSLLCRSTAAGSDFSKVDMLLANPLRLLCMIKEGKIELGQVRYLVLDEADKLFELGFMEQVDGIIAACSHKDVARALFSATLPEKVEELARSVLQQPLRVTVGVRNSAASTVKQRLLFVGREAGKLLALRQIIRDGLKPPVLVFVASKERAKALHRELMYDGVHVDSIHSEQSASARSAAVDNFRLGRTWLLIATDLIGRGMDFIGVQTVVNYDFPHSTSDYIHRVGRTGRAGHAGEAVTFFTEDDSGQLRSVANLVKEAGGTVPDWMMQLKKDRNKKQRRLPPQVASGASISTMPKVDREKRKRKEEMIAASKKRKAASIIKEKK